MNRRRGGSPIPIRVLFHSKVWARGGVERWIATLAAHFNPAVVCVAGIIVDEEPVDFNNKDNITRTNDWDGHADILITWGGTLPDSLRGFLGVVIGVCHGGPENPWQKVATAAMTRCCNVVVGVSKCSHENVIYSGVDSSTTLARRPVAKPFKKTLVFIGRVSSEKRPDIIPDVVDNLPEDWGAVIVGPDRWCHVREHPRVLRIPVTDDVGAWYSVADCVIIPSVSEGFCYTMFEAWASRVPTVCGDWPVLREIEQLAGAELSKKLELSATPKQWAQAVLGAEVSDKAWELTRTTFSAHAMARRWENRILNLLA